MGDGAKAMTKAGRDEFINIERSSRLMCWSHVHRNITPQLRSIATFSAELSENILNDIQDLQWSVLNEETFRFVFSLLEKKYLNKYESLTNDCLQKFFQYMRTVWVESGEFRWYEGAHPWEVSNNQGIEGKNKEIKQSHTFRERLEVGVLFSVMLRLVKEWSEEDDHILNSSRLAMLDKQVDSLKLRTEGYQWVRNVRFKPVKILKINQQGKYTVSEDFDLGEVDNIWSVDSTKDKSGKLLKDKTKERFQNRKVPTSSSFDEYISMRTSCWILEERNGDFFCDCPVGMKGKLCKHTVGMLYKEEYLEATSDVRAVPLGQKRRKGRPKQLPHCLASSPKPQESSRDKEDANMGVDIAPLKMTSKRKRKTVPETVEHEANVTQSPVHVLQSQSKAHAGLGNSKPPKKRSRLAHPLPSAMRSA